jgi:hypothetical protein
VEEIVVKAIPEHGGVSMTRAEQETIVTIGALDKVANICSNDPGYWSKLDKMCEKCPNEYKLIRVHRTKDGLILCKWYEVPRKLVRFAPPIAKRELTEEQRAAIRERLQKAREAKSAG